MDQLSNDIRLANWTAIVRECSTSTMSKQDWCRQNGVNIKSYYYWQKKVRQSIISPETPAAPFTEVKIRHFQDAPSDGVAAVLHKSDMHIEIMNTVSEDFLMKLMRSLSNA